MTNINRTKRKSNEPTLADTSQEGMCRNNNRERKNRLANEETKTRHNKYITNGRENEWICLDRVMWQWKDYRKNRFLISIINYWNETFTSELRSWFFPNFRFGRKRDKKVWAIVSMCTFGGRRGRRSNNRRPRWRLLRASQFAHTISYGSELYNTTLHGTRRTRVLILVLFQYRYRSCSTRVKPRHLEIAAQTVAAALAGSDTIHNATSVA